MPTVSAETVEVFLLGRFEVRRGERVLKNKAWKRRKAAALLQRLALEERLLRDEILDFLWADLDPERAANNLYRTLYSMRKQLDESLGAGTSGLVCSYQDGVLRLGAEVAVDTHRFESLCREERERKGALQAPVLEEALAIYEGPLLPAATYDAWSEPARERLHQLYREACLQLAGSARDTVGAPRHITRLRALLDMDAADEAVHHSLMRLLALSGRRHEALRQYEACRKALNALLGVPPTAETRQMHSAILQGTFDEEFSPPDRATQPTPPAVFAPAIAAQRRETPLAGRAGALAHIEAALEETEGGEGKVLLIEGPTGIGKTRLAREMAQQATARGMTSMWGAAYEFEGQLAYQPFSEAIDRYLLVQQDATVKHPLTNFTPQESGDPQQEKWALFSNTGAFFAGLSGDAPLLLFIDDLHAADEATLQLFHYLARLTRARPFLLAAAYRSDIALDPASPFSALLSTLYRERLRETVRLHPLQTEAVAQVVSHACGGPVDDGLVAAIMAIAEGNPFFVEEICLSLLRSEHVVQDGDRWRLISGERLEAPSDLRQLLRQRVAQNGPAVTSALEAASIVGRSFAVDLLRRVSVLDEADMDAALETALDAGFIEEDATGYRFRHGLTRHALYHAQSGPRRRRLHAMVAQAIEEMDGVADGAQDHVEALAYHYERSDRPQEGIRYLVAAGKRAADVYAFEGAVTYYQHALSLMGEQTEEDRRLRWELLETMGWWEKVLANTPRAVSHFEAALAMAEGDGWQPAPNEVARAHAGAAMALLSAGDTDAAQSHLQAAEAQVSPDENASEYADILYNVAQLHWHRNEYHESFEAAQRSLEIAEQLDDDQAVARAFEMLALACHSLGEWQLGLDFEEKRSAIAGPELDVTDAFDVHL